MERTIGATRFDVAPATGAENTTLNSMDHAKLKQTIWKQFIPTSNKDCNASPSTTVPSQ